MLGRAAYNEKRPLHENRLGLPAGERLVLFAQGMGYQLKPRSDLNQDGLVVHPEVIAQQKNLKPFVQFSRAVLASPLRKQLEEAGSGRLPEMSLEAYTALRGVFSRLMEVYAEMRKVSTAA